MPVARTIVQQMRRTAISSEYMRALNRRVPSIAGTPKCAEVIARRMVDLAMSGDVAAVKEITDRVEGKPEQINHNINTDNPLTDLLDHVENKGSLIHNRNVEEAKVVEEGEAGMHEAVHVNMPPSEPITPAEPAPTGRRFRYKS